MGCLPQNILTSLLKMQLQPPYLGAVLESACLGLRGTKASAFSQLRDTVRPGQRAGQKAQQPPRKLLGRTVAVGRGCGGSKQGHPGIS